MLRYIVSCFFAIMIAAAIRSICIYKRVGYGVLKKVSGRVILPVLTFSLSVGFFLPANLIISNSADFLVNLGDIAWVLLAISAVLFLTLFCISVLISNDAIDLRWVLLIASVSLALYVQSAWINPKLPELTGRMIDWSEYVPNMVMDGTVWFVIILLPQLLFKKLESANIGKICNYVALCVGGVQLAVFIILLAIPKDTVLPEVNFSYDGEYTLGDQKNIVIFVLDSLGADNYSDAVRDYPEITEELDDFTFFSNEVAGGSYTDLGIPALMTGVEYPASGMNYFDYLDDAWSTVDIYDRLSADGYDIRFYTDNRYVKNVNTSVVNNAIEGDKHYYIGEIKRFVRELCKLSAFYALPTSVKKYFYINTTDITDCIEADHADTVTDISMDEEGIFFDDARFYEKYQECGGFSIDYSKTFRLYHMIGSHAPFILDKNGKPAAEGTSSDSIQTAGCFHIVGDMIRDMKAKGVYENSTIIITGDHGQGGVEHGIQQNSCLLIKQAGVSHEYREDKSPVHVRNLMATIADEAGFDYMPYGPRVWDIDVSSDPERLHTARRASIGQFFPDMPEDIHSVRCEIGIDALDLDSIVPLEESERNAIEYTIGDVIELKEKSEYADSLNERLYYDEEGATASNELYLFFKLRGYNNKDLRFNFICDKVYNDNQCVRIYAEGERIATLTCSTENTGSTCTVLIPGEYINDDILPLRLVFPGAIEPRMLDESSDDARILSVHINKMWLSE
ncbi:MAG: LTA synthase family protein [Lachnospiraceae bacterium]|nr:LTA synthase family protein [Lachnospiraceae bacterium]